MGIEKIPNFGLHWIGWETDVYSLARQGWNFYTDTDYMYRSYSLAMQNDKYNIIGYIQRIAMEFMEEYGYKIREESLNNANHWFPKLPVNFLNFKQAITIQNLGVQNATFSKVEEVYSMPHSTSIKLTDLLPDNKKEESRIIVPEYTIPELMNMIKEKQRPMQDEIRKAQRKDEHVEKPVAQIVSIA